MAIQIYGKWRIGFALDLHTHKSEFLGYNDNGRKMFDTERTEIGELVYNLKYKNDLSVVSLIVNYILKEVSLEIMNAVISVPPSDLNRQFQPLYEVGHALSQEINIPFFKDAIIKIKDTPQLKDILEQDERERILADAFMLNENYTFYGLNVLVIDDLFRSGATLNAVTSVLYNQATARNVYVLTLTKTRSKR